MPYQTEVLNQGAAFLCHWSGKATANELLDFSRNLLQIFPNHEVLTKGVVDFSAIEHLEISYDEMEELLKQTKITIKYLNPGRIAIVAPSPLIYGLSRMYQARRGVRSWTVEVFNSMTDALAWLNL